MFQYIHIPLWFIIINCFYSLTISISINPHHHFVNINLPTITTTLENRKKWCEGVNLKYGIIPGSSFGSLPTNMHKGYLSVNCDQFFCLPHSLRKGVYQ